MIHPLAILAGLPLALGGAATALAVTGSALDLAALIGLLTLLGIVAKNGILVVDEAIQRMDAGELRRRAIVTAAATRTRPIIMTTLAMIAGMIPIVIGLAPDAAFRAPMAWAVIGGLISSTALSLLVTPALFLLADRMRCRLARITGAVVRMPTASERAS
jgi:multidrug efflux pump subunit AcrB